MKHPFLSDTACIHRLLKEYQQHGSLVIAYDFDNCVYDYHNKGHDYQDVIKLLKQAKKIKLYLIVFTAEQDLKKVRSYLDNNGIPYDAINENPPFYKSDARKIYFNLLLDDRAGLKSAYNQLKQVISIINHKI